MRHGVLVRTDAGTYLTVEFDSRDEAERFHDRLRREERLRVAMRVAADAVETVDLHAPEFLDEVQPIVSLSE
jgi:hypothetical protein